MERYAARCGRYLAARGTGTTDQVSATRAGTVVLVNVKKIVGILALALVIFFIVTSPSGAAALLGNIGNILSNAATSIISFFQQLF